MKLNCLVFALLMVFVATMATSSRADTLSITWAGAAGVYSGSGAGLPGTTWLDAEFNKTGANTVDLTLTANFLSGSPLDVDQVDFNLDPDITPSNLSFTFGASNATTVTPTATTDDAQKAGPAFGFDVQFGSGQGSHALGSGGGPQTDVIHITLNGGGTLDAADFGFQSTPGNNNIGPFFAAAHVQNTGIDGQDSAWVAASPAPASVWSGVAMLTGLAVFRQLRRRSV